MPLVTSSANQGIRYCQTQNHNHYGYKNYNNSNQQKDADKSTTNPYKQKRQDANSWRVEEIEKPYQEEAIWDENFQKNKFQFGRVITRDIAHEMNALNIDNNKPNLAPKVVRTTNVDTFLNCEQMDFDQLQEGAEKEDEDEADPLWDDVDVEEIKQEPATNNVGSS